MKKATLFMRFGAGTLLLLLVYTVLHQGSVVDFLLELHNM